MFCFIIGNKNTGEIEHCFIDNGDDIDFKTMIKEGDYPLKIDPMPDYLFYSIIEEEDLINCLADPKIKRKSNDKKAIKKTLQYQDQYGGYSHEKIRSEIKVFPGKTKKVKSLNNDNKLCDCEIHVRQKCGKINPVDGHVIEDLEHFDEIVSESKKKQKAAEEQDLLSKISTNELNDIKEYLKKEVIAELKRDLEFDKQTKI